MFLRYYAYSFIRDYIEEPFTTMMPEHVFHIALYIWNVRRGPSSPAVHRVIPG